jgi:hypothetical protein
MEEKMRFSSNYFLFTGIETLVQDLLTQNANKNSCTNTAELGTDNGKSERHANADTQQPTSYNKEPTAITDTRQSTVTTVDAPDKKEPTAVIDHRHPTRRNQLESLTPDKKEPTAINDTRQSTVSTRQPTPDKKEPSAIIDTRQSTVSTRQIT